MSLLRPPVEPALVKRVKPVIACRSPSDDITGVFVTGVSQARRLVFTFERPSRGALVLSTYQVVTNLPKRDGMEDMQRGWYER